jgi:hypothetical protein
MSASPTPADAIQRILFICPRVHIYSLPPLTTTKGYTAALWTDDNNRRQIFTARIRIIETATPSPHADVPEPITTEILLEDPATADLFASVPYTDPGAVEATLDSARFFAVRVVGEGGRKATLGIGFEERGEAIDFNIALQEVRKVQGIGGEEKLKVGAKGLVKEVQEEKKDFRLKEGEMIHVDIGERGRRKQGGGLQGDEKALFSIAPPPYVNKGGGLLPPPPSAKDMKKERRRSGQGVPKEETSAAALGFDDGEFGEFQ